MLRCIAIDDEPLALRQVRSCIEKIPSNWPGRATMRSMRSSFSPRIPSI